MDLAVLGRLMGADGQAVMRAGLGDAAEGSVRSRSLIVFQSRLFFLVVVADIARRVGVAGECIVGCYGRGARYAAHWPAAFRRQRFGHNHECSGCISNVIAERSRWP